MQKLIKRNINLQRCQTKSAPGNHKQLNLAPILSQLSFTQIMSAVTQRACGQVTRDLHVTWAAQILQQAQKKKRPTQSRNHHIKVGHTAQILKQEGKIKQESAERSVQLLKENERVNFLRLLRIQHEHCYS